MKLLLKSNEILWYWLGLRFIQPVYGRYWYVENPVVEYYKYELFLGDSYHSTLNPKFNSKFSLINRIRCMKRLLNPKINFFKIYIQMRKLLVGLLIVGLILF